MDICILFCYLISLDGWFIGFLLTLCKHADRYRYQNNDYVGGTGGYQDNQQQGYNNGGGYGQNQNYANKGSYRQQQGGGGGGDYGTCRLKLYDLF